LAAVNRVRRAFYSVKSCFTSKAKLLGPIEVDGYILTKHGEMPTPRLGMESHHGAMSRWMREHFVGYKEDAAPAVLMPKEAHNATRGVYNTWRAHMRKQMGGKFEWRKISENQIRTLADKMFEVSKTPQIIQTEYWQWFNRMIEALEKQQTMVVGR